MNSGYINRIQGNALNSIMKFQRLSLALIQLPSASLIGNRSDLLSAISMGHFEAIEKGIDMRLIRQHGAEFLEAAADSGNQDMVQLLLSRGASPVGGAFKKGVLDVAVSSGNMDMVSMLVEHGANPARLNPETVADVVIKGDLELYGYLLDRGYDSGPHCQDMLHSAVLSDSLDMVKVVMQTSGKFESEDYLLACQKALQMGNHAIFEQILAFDRHNIVVLLEKAVETGNLFMAKHLDAYIAGRQCLPGKQIYLVLAKKASSAHRYDIASLMLDHLEPSGLREFLSDVQDRSGFFAMVMQSKNIREAIRGCIDTTKNLITSALACDQPEMVRFVIKHAGIPGLSACSRAIRMAEKLDFLTDLIEHDSAKEALLYDLQETAALFNATFGNQAFAAHKIIELLDGTTGSVRLLANSYISLNDDAVREILSLSPKIHQAIRLAPDSAHELYVAAIERKDEEMKRLAWSGLSGEVALLQLRRLWRVGGLTKKQKLAEIAALLQELPHPTISAAFDEEYASFYPIQELLALLKEHAALSDHKNAE
jgi:hypothetical protein